MFSRLAAVAVLLAAVTGFASVTEAATIHHVLHGGDPKKAWDPTTDNILQTYGGHGSYIGYSSVITSGPDRGLFLPGGVPLPENNWAYQGTSGGGTNPAELLFQYTGSGGGGGGGGGSGGGVGPDDGASNYRLGNNLGGEWAMTFTILFYDPGFAGSQVDVFLTGTAGGTDNVKSLALTAADVNAGMVVSFDIDAEADEMVNVDVIARGDETYAAGFFMDNAAFSTASATAPEPATLLLLAAGAGVSLWRRRRA